MFPIIQKFPPGFRMVVVLMPYLFVRPSQLPEALILEENVCNVITLLELKRYNITLCECKMG